MEIKIQSAIVLGSFAYGRRPYAFLALSECLELILTCLGTESNIDRLVQAGAVTPLLAALSPSNDIQLVEAAARSLKALYNSPNVPRDALFSPPYLRNITQLLEALPTHIEQSEHCHTLTTGTTCMSAPPSHQTIQIAELAASIIARACDSVAQQRLFADTDVIPALIRLLSGGHSKVCKR